MIGNARLRGSKMILVVDDESSNLWFFKAVLENAGYHCCFAKCGTEALTRCRDRRPDLVLLDIMMPEMDGYDVCRQLKKHAQTAKTPIIFVTGVMDKRSETLAFDVGAVDFITKPVNASVLLARVKTHLSLVRMTEFEAMMRDAVFMLGEAGHYNDTDTGLHIWRMAAYSAALARAIGWDEDRVGLLELAAPLHDTGKIGIPDEILKAPRGLTDCEWSIMKSHCEIGYRILSKSKSPLFRMGAEVALCHHERWDGKGYPNRLRGIQIPESARIVAIADVFDALTTSRSYKESWSRESAMEEIKKCRGTLFEPRLVDAFSSLEDDVFDLKRRWDQLGAESRGDVRPSLVQSSLELTSSAVHGRQVPHHDIQES